MAVALLAAPAAAEDDSGVNATYERMARAYAERNRTPLATIFHSQMVTSSAAPNQPPVIGGAALAEQIGAGLDQLRRADRNAELSFRITHRGWVAGTAIDVGVLRMRTWGGDREPRTVYSRFVSTFVKRDDGRWVFLTDSPAAASQAAWDSAKPFPAAKFDQ